MRLPRLLLALTFLGTLASLPLLAAVPGDRVFAGTVYNVFHEEFATDADFCAQVDRDIPAIAAAGLTHVLVFPMNEWDPATRERRWTRTDYLIHKIETSGLKFIPILLKEEQCSHYFPIWKFRDTADRWSVHHRRNGSRNNRENVDFADPRVFPVLEDSIRAVVERYRTSPALAFYNLWNEPHYDSDADHVVARFRTWLEKKYGTLAALRRAWGDDYTSWDEVSPFLNDDWNSSLPAIDWRLFRDELNGLLLGELAAIVRRLDPDHPLNSNPVGTPLANFADFGFYNTDIWRLTPYQDFNGASYYPDYWEVSHPGQSYPLWLHHLNFNVFRSAAADRGYILTELYTNAKNGLMLTGYVDPATISRLAWTALADDCKGILFWKWEPFRRGRQSLGRGLTRLDGTLAPRGEAVRDFAGVLTRHGQLLRTAHLVPPEVAIILDQVGLQKTLDQGGDARTRSFMFESHAGLFRALDEANLTADVLRSDLGLTLEQLRHYRIVFLPFQIVMRREFAAVLTEYVRQGGHLVADARTATIDELDYAYTTNPGAGLDELFAADRADWIGTPGDHAVAPVSGSKLPAFSGRYFREQLRLHPGAETLAVFPDTGEPALIAHSFGKGRAILAAVPLGASCHERPDSAAARVIIQLCTAAGATPPASFIPAPGTAGTLSLRVHHAPDGLVLYAINPSDAPLSGSITLPVTAESPPFAGARDLVTDTRLPLTTTTATASFPLALPARGVLVAHLRP